ncbi:MAG: RNA 3'-phosphate cyclase, partial [Acidobacteria bacterium]
MTTRPIQIDGGQGEGGGQVLRMGLAMAAIRGTPVEVHSIRAGRRRPGLQPQHLAAVRALARVCHGRVEGDAPGSMWLSFWPGTPTPGEYRFDIGTAGSATLVVQALLPVLATAGGPSRVSVRGGTHVPWSPPADYMREVLCPVLGAMGLDVRCETSAWGLYPAGGGELLVEIAGSTPLRPLSRLRSAGPLRVRGLSVVSRLSPEIAERQRDRAARRLQAAGLAADIAVRDVAARDPGTFVWLVVEAEGPLGGFSALGRRGVPAEQVADEAVDALLEFVRADAGCDPHLADQLILPMAL